MTPKHLIPPTELKFYHITNGVTESVGQFMIAADRWYDCYNKIDHQHITAYRELTTEERINFDNRQRTNMANDKRYNNTQQPTLF